jgi:hypothetical protein
MFDALLNPNPSRSTGITHTKFLCLLSALRNSAVPINRRMRLKSRNNTAWRDIYYRRIAHRLQVCRLWCGESSGSGAQSRFTHIEWIPTGVENGRYGVIRRRQPNWLSWMEMRHFRFVRPMMARLRRQSEAATPDTALISALPLVGRRVEEYPRS